MPCKVGYVHFWSGPVAPPTGIAIWEDDDVETFLNWGRAAYDTTILYLHEEEVEDSLTDGSKRIVACWFIGGQSQRRATLKASELRSRPCQWRSPRTIHSSSMNR
jgi:hypothetical protein